MSGNFKSALSLLIRKISRKEISPDQVNIIIIALVVITAFGIIWLYIFVPARSGVALISRELNKVKREVQTIKATMKPGRSVEEEIDALEKEYFRLYKIVPRDEDETLTLLADYARSLNLTVGSVLTHEPITALDANNNRIVIEGTIFKKLPIEMKLRGRYADIIRFAEVLRESIPAPITINDTQITVLNPETGQLDIQTNLYLYLLTKK